MPNLTDVRPRWRPAFIHSNFVAEYRSRLDAEWGRPDVAREYDVPLNCTRVMASDPHTNSGPFRVFVFT